MHCASRYLSTFELQGKARRERELAEDPFKHEMASSDKEERHRKDIPATQHVRTSDGETSISAEGRSRGKTAHHRGLGNHDFPAFSKTSTRRGHA